MGGNDGGKAGWKLRKVSAAAVAVEVGGVFYLPPIAVLREKRDRSPFW